MKINGFEIKRIFFYFLVGICNSSLYEKLISIKSLTLVVFKQPGLFINVDYRQKNA